MNVYNLVVTNTDVNEILFSEVWSTRANAIHSLGNWVKDEWDSEILGDINDFDGRVEEIVEYFFDHEEDFLFYLEAVKAPKEAEHVSDEVLLTPGMCGIIETALNYVGYVDAAAILVECKELPSAVPAVECVAAGRAMIEKLIEEFRQ